MNPFVSFCLFVAARVFVQYLKKRPDDQEVRQSLEFLLAAMQALQRNNPLSASFLVLLNTDIEGSGLDTSIHNPDYTSRYVSQMVSSLRRFIIIRLVTLQPHDSSLTQPQGANNLLSDCSPIFLLSETSEDGRSPEDKQFPKFPKESPTLRTEDPRQKTYAYRGADLNAQERGKSRTFFPENTDSYPYLAQDDIQNKPDAHGQRFDQIFPSDDWNQGNMAAVAGLREFPENDKINAINANNRQLDTEMADQSVNSRGPTPLSNSSYYHSSSNTSYSPSQPHEDDQNASGAGGGDNYVTGFAPPSHNTIFTGQGVEHENSTSAQREEDLSKFPAGWDMGTGMRPDRGVIPGGLTGMTPDGGWEKLMDSIGWETGRTG